MTFTEQEHAENDQLVRLRLQREDLSRTYELAPTSLERERIWNELSDLDVRTDALCKDWSTERKLAVNELTRTASMSESLKREQCLRRQARIEKAAVLVLGTAMAYFQKQYDADEDDAIDHALTMAEKLVDKIDNELGDQFYAVEQRVAGTAT